MRTRGRSAPVLPLALVAGTSACDPVNVALAGGLWWFFSLFALLLTAVVVGMFRRRTWYRLLEDWEPPRPLAASGRWWMRPWVPIISVLVISCVFAWYVFYGNPIPSPPGQQFLNLAMWILGSGIGTVGGFLAGRKLAVGKFEKAYPVNLLQGSANESPQDA